MGGRRPIAQAGLRLGKAGERESTPTQKGDSMSVLTIIIIVVLVLLVLGFFGRGRMGR